jgi:hypothetical protein
MIGQVFFWSTVAALLVACGTGKLSQLSTRERTSEPDTAPEPAAHLHTEEERTDALRALHPDEVSWEMRWEIEFEKLRLSLDELVDHTLNVRLGRLEELCEEWVNKPAPWVVRWNTDTTEIDAAALRDMLRADIQRAGSVVA